MWTAVRRGDETQIFLGVRFTVTEIALVVIVGFFAHCDAEYKGQWCDICNNESWEHMRSLKASMRGICAPILRAGTN